jgi:hypothetical protein
MGKKLPLLIVVAFALGTAVAGASASAPTGDAQRALAAGGAAQAGRDLAATARRRRCDRNYSGRCLRPNVSDYDCAGGSGNGPWYVRGPFTVVGDDHYGLDSDGDGVACES